MYELSMVVAHVRESWMEAPGNLVAHIRVSPFYHARKQVTTDYLVQYLNVKVLLCHQIPGHFQWYLFNDFAITPADEVL